MRAAARLGREILDKAHAAIRPGITTDEIDRIVHEATIEGALAGGVGRRCSRCSRCIVCDCCIRRNG